MLIQPLQFASVPYVPRFGHSVEVAGVPPTIVHPIVDDLVEVGTQLSPWKFALHPAYLASKGLANVSN